MPHWRDEARDLLARAGHYVRTAPATYCYLGALTVTTGLARAEPADVRRRLLLERSTNLTNMGHEPLRALVLSAFWLPDLHLLFWAIAFTLVLAPLEHRAGALTGIAVFTLGHVGATLATIAGLVVALHNGWAGDSVRDAIDVGVSYGFFACAACACGWLPRRTGRLGAVALVVATVAMVAVGRSFTDWGHLVAVLIGFALIGPTHRLAAPSSSSASPRSG